MVMVLVVHLVLFLVGLSMLLQSDGHIPVDERFDGDGWLPVDNLTSLQETVVFLFLLFPEIVAQDEATSDYQQY